MEPEQIWELVQNNWHMGIFTLLTFVEFSKIKINPWSWLFSFIGKALNKDVMTQLDEIKGKQTETDDRLAQHIEDDEVRAADAKRRAILAFNNEVCRGVLHTKEAWIDILKDVDDYRLYCHSHPNYQNSRAEAAIENITRSWRIVLHNGNFLQPNIRSKRKWWFR